VTSPYVIIVTCEVACVIIIVLSVCLSGDNFQKHGHGKFIFTRAVYIKSIRVKFVYEDH